MNYKNTKIIFIAIILFSLFGLAKSSQAVYPAPRHFQRRFRLMVGAIAKRLRLSAILLVKFYQKMVTGHVAGRKRLPLLGFLLACCIFFVSFTFASPAYGATTYYVSPSGNDSNNGLIGAPFKTIQKAADIVNPGDTVIVKDGTYTESITQTRGGTANNWVTFKAENKWGAKLNGQNNYTGIAWLLGAGSSYTRIEGFEIYGYKYMGIITGNGVDVSNVYLYQNNIHDIGRYCTSYAYGQSAIYMGTLASYWTFDSNLVHDNGRYKAGENGCLESVCYTDSDRCGVLDQALYLNGSYGVITNNIFYNNNSGMDVAIKGSYGTTAGKHWKVINNTFGQGNYRFEGRLDLTAADSGYTGSVDDILIENNLFLSTNTWAIMCWAWPNYCGSTTLTNIVIKNNMTNSEALIFYIPSLGAAANPYTNPGFTFANNQPELNLGGTAFVSNFAGHDFSLKENSPAINVGIYAGVDYDAEGKSRDGNPDIGAYEYVSGGGGDITSPASPTGLTVL